MVILRVTAYLLLILAFVFMVLDGIRSLAASSLIITPLGQLWYSIHAESLNFIQSFIESSMPSFLWDPIFLFILQLPGWLTPGLLALVLAFAGRLRPRERKWISEIE